MTGRGKPRKAKSPDTKSAKNQTRPEEIKSVSLARCPGKDITAARQNGATKEQKPKEQKKANHTAERPSARSTRKDETTKHFTEVRGTKAKTCAGRAKTTEQSAEEVTPPQPGTSVDTTKASLKTPKAKRCSDKAKSPEELTDEIKTHPQTPKDTAKASLKTTKAKRCGGEAQSPVDFAEGTTTTHPQTPKDTTKASLNAPKAKQCSDKAKSPEELTDEIKTHPQTPKDTAKASLKTTKAKRCGGEAQSPVDFAEGTTTHPQTPKDTTKASLNAPKAKPCSDKAKSPEEFAMEITKTHPLTPKDTAKACVPQDRCEANSALDSLLYTTLEKLKIKRNEKSDAAEVVNKIIQHIIVHLKKNTECFKKVEEPLRTGSYYEYLKISNPDEFDVMLPIPVDRVSIKPFGDDGAFYSVALKRCTSPLQRFQEDSTLSASKMLEEFREEVKKSVKEFKEWEMTKKKKGCPAVTLITKVQSVTISLDVVLSLVVKSSWPHFTNTGLKIERWLGAKVKQEYKRKPYYLVPKYEGWGTVENDGVLAKDIWRVSFSHIEKAMLKNHGSEKTCCEKGGEHCCRKDCLKLLKHLLSLLKEKDRSFDKFSSYHAKTTLLHACCSRAKDSDWRASGLSHCFRLLLDDFVAHLQRGELDNFFIPTQNLLSGPGPTRCSALARCIREEGDKGFPIFKRYTLVTTPASPIASESSFK